MPWNRSPEARTIRRTAAGARAGGLISLLCVAHSHGDRSTLELAMLFVPFSTRTLGVIAWGGLVLSGVAIGAALGHLACDFHWDDFG